MPHHQKRCALPCVTIFAFVVLAIFAGVVFPARAYAQSYEITKVSIEAEVQTDGSLRVRETRSVQFDDACTELRWDFGSLSEGCELTVNSIRLLRQSDTGDATGEGSVESVTLVKALFQSEWRSGGGPAGDAFAVDARDNVVYAFFSAKNELITFEFDYTISNAAIAYHDVAELSWKYVGDFWEVDSQNVTCIIALPLPEGESAVSGEDVFAWGHGPLSGELDISSSGSVTYKVDQVRSGQYAEARIAFPSSWLTSVGGSTGEGRRYEDRLSQILSEETDWSDRADSQRMQSFAFVVGSGLVCALMVALSIVCFLLWGKEREPRFKEKYCREAPRPGLHPAVVSRLWNWNRQRPEDFVATVLHLARIGAVSVVAGKRRNEAGQLCDDYLLVRNDEVDASLLDSVDKAALEFAFATVAPWGNLVGDAELREESADVAQAIAFAQDAPVKQNAASRLWLSEIRAFASRHPQEFIEGLRGFHQVLSERVAQEDFFDAKSKAMQRVSLIATAVLLVAGVMASSVFHSLWNWAFLAPTLAVMLLVTNYMPRRTEEGNEVVAHCKALRNWLRDFPELGERPSKDAAAWEELLAYAFAFGVSDTAVRHVREVSPGLFAPAGTDSDAAASTSETVGSAGVVAALPWWVWYDSFRTNAGGAPKSASALLQETLSETMKVAHEAISLSGGLPDSNDAR